MNFAEEFCVWWFYNVFKPFSQFVIFDHPLACSAIIAVIITVLLGCFYKEDPYEADKWMEKWGYPLIILIVGTLFIPSVAVFFALVLPIIILLAMPIGALMCLYCVLQKARERHLLEQIWRYGTQKKEIRNDRS